MVIGFDQATAGVTRINLTFKSGKQLRCLFQGWSWGLPTFFYIAYEDAPDDKILLNSAVLASIECYDPKGNDSDG